MKRNTIFLMFIILNMVLVSAVDFIEPLELRRWFVDILSGSPAIFTAVALLTIFAFAGFFRMNMLTTGFMVAMFFLMFSAVVDQSIYFLILAVGSLVAGYTISKIVKR